MGTMGYVEILLWMSFGAYCCGALMMIIFLVKILPDPVHNLVTFALAFGWVFAVPILLYSLWKDLRDSTSTHNRVLSLMREARREKERSIQRTIERERQEQQQRNQQREEYLSGLCCGHPSEEELRDRVEDQIETPNPIDQENTDDGE